MSAVMLPEGSRVRITHFRMCVECGELHAAGVFRKDDCTDQIAAKGGRTHAEVTLPDGSVHVGVARCRPDESFNRRIGRDVAIGRALAAAPLARVVSS